MSNDKPEIKFSEEGQIGPSKFERSATEKFRNIDTLIYAVIVSLVITSISSLIAVGAIVIDQLHFNNTTYASTLRQSGELSKLNDQIVQMRIEIDTLKIKANGATP